MLVDVTLSVEMGCCQHLLFSIWVTVATVTPVVLKRCLLPLLSFTVVAINGGYLEATPLLQSQLSF